MLGGYAPFRRDVLLYNSETQDPATIKRLMEEVRSSNKAVPGFVVGDDAPPEELELVERRLGWIPSWIESFAHLGKPTSEIYSKGMAASVAGINPFDLALSRLPIAQRMAGRDPLNQALYSWARVHLPNFILTFLSDRMEMAHSIEGRVPFLDTRVAEFCAGMPIHMKINGMREKHVLREAARDVIIEPVYNREKHPFSTPPARVGEDDALPELYGDTFASSLLDDATDLRRTSRSRDVSDLSHPRPGRTPGARCPLQPGAEHDADASAFFDVGVAVPPTRCS